MRILFLILVFMIGCSGGSSSSDKSLFSSWTGNGKTIDLTGMNFGTNSMTLFFATGAKCSCTLDLVGTQATGSFVISACSYTTGGTGDPGCSSLNGNGTYSKTSSVLTFCNSSSGTCLGYN